MVGNLGPPTGWAAGVAQPVGSPPPYGFSRSSLYGLPPSSGLSSGIKGLTYIPEPNHAYGKMALALGRHLTPSIKEKVLKGEYVGIFSLLHGMPEPTEKSEDKPKGREVIKRAKTGNWSNWLKGFIVYAGFIACHDTQRGALMWKYLDII